MSDAEKNAETADDLPLKDALEHNFSGFRSQSRQRRGTNEKDSAASPLQALTEDSSAKFWSVYISEAERYDSALVESWKADMEGMLIFSGLFSASLTAFIIESYKSLVPDTGDTTVFLLSQLTQQLSAQFNGSHFALSSPPAFETPTSSLLCNGLFFVSLGLSLTCALLATLVEQWAREFLHKTERVHSPVRRARVFSFLYYGVSRFGIHAIVDIIPLLLHLGLVLFFAGLAVFLLPINSIMAGIVTSVLVVFVTFYVVITVLPVISLDCPYRTPFSAIFWRIVQYLSMLFNLPSTGRNLTDEVLAAAMQRRDIRDERAVLWTLEALTDNNELLPFVEATHEIIDGPTGLRRVDDYLFRLVLQTGDPHTSLPRRILSLLWSAETLPLNDPLRDRRQIAGLRALWALGIVTARIARAPASEVYGINRTGLYALRIPTAYRLSLEAVISYVYLKSIQARFEDIETMFSFRDLSIPRERRRLVQFLRGTISGLEHDCKRAGIALEIDALLRPLGRLANSDPDDPDSAPETAKQVMERLHGGRMISWPMHYSKIAVRLVDAAFREGVAPYRMLPTCKEIFPGVLAAPGQLLPLETFLGKGPEVLPTSLHTSLGDAAQNDLDTIMRCGLRLLPLLDPATFLPTIYWYLSKRTGDINWQYAFRDCSLDILAKAILTGITSSAIFDHHLRGIVRLCLWSNNFTAVLDCERVLANVEAKQIGLPSELPTVKAILSARVLVLLGSKLRIGGAPPRDPPDLGIMHEIASHPLLQGTDGTDSNNPMSPATLIETHDRLVRQLCERFAVEVIAFLAACTSPVQLPYMAEATARYLRREWDLFLNERMSVRTQREYAQAVLTLFKCAYDENHPQRAGIHSIAQSLCEMDPDSKLARNITDLESRGLLAQAMSLGLPEN